MLSPTAHCPGCSGPTRGLEPDFLGQVLYVCDAYDPCDWSGNNPEEYQLVWAPIPEIDPEDEYHNRPGRYSPQPQPTFEWVGSIVKQERDRAREKMILERFPSFRQASEFEQKVMLAIVRSDEETTWLEKLRWWKKNCFDLHLLRGGLA